MTLAIRWLSVPVKHDLFVNRNRGEKFLCKRCRGFELCEQIRCADNDVLVMFFITPCSGKLCKQDGTFVARFIETGRWTVDVHKTDNIRLMRTDFHGVAPTFCKLFQMTCADNDLTKDLTNDSFFEELTKL